MSLINDALRSARDSQPKTIRGADGPAYRPAESKDSGPRPLFSLPFLVTVLLLLAGFFIVNFSVNEGPALQVRARTRRANAPVAEPAPATSTSAPVMVATTPTVEPIKATEPAGTITAEPAPATDSANAESFKPAAPTYKLQSIVYNLKHPSALINNHVVFIGEHVGDARVTAIDKETVTIITTSGQTIVLDMFH